MDKEARKNMLPVNDHINCILDKMERIEGDYPSILGNYTIDFTHFQIKEKEGFIIPYRIKKEMETAIIECNSKFL